MWQRLRVIIRKEFIQALREPRMRFILIMPPLVQMIIFGLAVNLDVENARIGWMDLDKTPLSRELGAEFEGSPNFTLTRYPASDQEVQEILDTGPEVAVVRILSGFSRAVHRGQGGSIQILVDGTNSNTAALVSSYATRVVGRFAARQPPTASDVRNTGPRLDVRSRVWFNPELKSRNYFVPGVVVNIIALVTVMLTALSIVREKEIGTMEQLMVTPIRPLELMLGKTLPFASIGMFQVVLLSTFAMFVFQVPFRGSFIVLLGCAVVFLMTTLGAGLFISTISSTQQQAMMTFFFMFFPMFLLSGFAFPISSMPTSVQYLTYVNPIRYFIEIVRGIFLKGVGVSILWPQISALAVIGIVVLTFSTLRFKKTLD